MKTWLGRWGVICAVALAACKGSELTSPPATVQFAIDAPFCGTTVAVLFTVDGQLVGQDTFRIHLSDPHTTSRGFSIAPGHHSVGAHTGYGYVWADTNVTVTAGGVFTDTLPFYCS